MAKISYREKLLLGYNPNTLSNSSSSRRNSADVDFSDVFGGPPRCSSSTQEYYHYNNDIDSIDENDGDDDADNGFGLSEKPVFGYHQKRFGSDDFYDDIFGGDQFVLSSSLSSPRVVLMSPPRTSSAAVAAEPSSPSKFSLPGRAANTDTMTSTSMNQSLTKFFGRSLSRFNNTVQKHSTINSGDAHTSNLSSSLPSRIAVDEKRLTGDCKIKGTRDQHEPKFNMEGSKSYSKVANDTMQFHFSIYKWANTGVPSVMSSRKRSPSRPKERMTSDANLIMEDSKRNVINVNVNVNEATLSSKRRMPSTAAQEREHERNNNDIAAGGGKSHVEWKLKDDKVKNNNTSSNNEVGEGHSGKDLEAKLIKQPQKVKKSNMKPLRTLFGQEKEGSKKATVEKGQTQSKVNETEKQQSVKNEVFPNHKVSRKSKVHEPSIGKTDDLRKGEVSEIAKDFVKIFNQGSHEKSYVSTFPTKNHDEMQASYGNLRNMSYESIEVIDGESFLSGEQEFNIKSSGIPNSAYSASNDGASNDASRASAPKSSAPFVEDNMGKVVTQVMDSPLAIESEETQTYERKVRQWSKGKEGNIRALLSTMQNILWPNSGWKPVPLVDIIEANAVKKAYQRALLCLHPDKLQQKGAAPHHKFIAEKVFDVLQEAWDQFNSLGTL